MDWRQTFNLPKGFASHIFPFKRPSVLLLSPFSTVHLLRRSRMLHFVSIHPLSTLIFYSVLLPYWLSPPSPGYKTLTCKVGSGHYWKYALLKVLDIGPFGGSNTSACATTCIFPCDFLPDGYWKRPDSGKYWANTSRQITFLPILQDQSFFRAQVQELWMGNTKVL